MPVAGASNHDTRNEILTDSIFNVWQMSKTRRDDSLDSTLSKEEKFVKIESSEGNGSGGTHF